mmetsp:Transcript_86627/g.278111  ORF Transcript_86627/g.278111 Transcript_86627/m.278111 type:complete len:221 (+) Transcript_86627:190-852(+)
MSLEKTNRLQVRGVRSLANSRCYGVCSRSRRKVHAPVQAQGDFSACSCGFSLYAISPLSYNTSPATPSKLIPSRNMSENVSSQKPCPLRFLLRLLIVCDVSIIVQHQAGDSFEAHPIPQHVGNRFLPEALLHRGVLRFLLRSLIVCSVSILVQHHADDSFEPDPIPQHVRKRFLPEALLHRGPHQRAHTQTCPAVLHQAGQNHKNPPKVMPEKKGCPRRM